MAKGRLCKVTVVKKAYFPDLAEQFGESASCCPCHRFEVGQEFVLDQNGPTGFWHLVGGNFCSEAWASIGHYVDTILQGGRFETESSGNYTIACCPNGIRPTVFKIELAKRE